MSDLLMPETLGPETPGPETPGPETLMPRCDRSSHRFPLDGTWLQTASQGLLGLSTSALLFVLGSSSLAQDAPSLQEQVNQIQTEIEAIREARFKDPVQAQTQAPEAFNAYLEQQLSQLYSDEDLSQTATIVQALGLYRGPKIEDLKALAQKTWSTQAAAYYAPEKNGFFVLMQDLPETLLGVTYAHELYHAFQDQYFDLDAFYRQQINQLNEDELYARQAVVEGEATLVMNLWLLKQYLGQIPPEPLVTQTIAMQSSLDTQELLASLTASEQAGSLGEAAQAAEEIPAFILEPLLGSYIKGMGFVYEVYRQGGWAQVETLYDNPPVSTEQVLHPQKWFQNERPVALEWPDLEASPLFRDWTLLGTETLGEVQWRIVFAEHGLEREGIAAAAGWGGDTYAVFQNPKDEADLLVLLATAWDSEAEAEEFVATYERLLAVKYEGRQDTNQAVVRSGDRVLIVEGGDPSQTSAYLDLMAAMFP